MPIDWSRFAEIITAGKHFLLTSHMRPDCDALGSELGMAGVLEALGKQVTIVNGQPTPPHLAFLDAKCRIYALGEDIDRSDLESVDVLMVLDTSAWVQLGPMQEILRATSAKKLVLDHHVSEDNLGAQMFKDPDAESTGRLVVEAAEALGVPLSQPIAEPLLAAIATDTGWFRFSSVTGATHRAVAKLLDAGARPQELYTSLYEQDTFPRLLLRGRTMSAAASEEKGRLIYSQVTIEDFAETGTQRSDTEDIINMLFSVAGTEVAIMFIDQDDDNVKASLRSRGRIDVRAVAEEFGGGGHRAAAGVMLKGPMERAKSVVVDAVRKAMRQ